MRTRLFLAFVITAATLWANVAWAQNIAHGVKVVVLDAGHGGRFSGAHYAGIYEKDLTLQMILRLGKMIEEEMPGVKVVYTRTTDKMLGPDLASDLQARADIANRAEGDLFISIHVNAAGKSPHAATVRGVETLIMGESTKEQRYNENALFENNREDLIDMSDERTAAIVRAYIQNLQFTYGEYSMALARCMQNNYVKAGRVSRGIKPQLLRVLYATDMPGVLTEIGFLSNPQEAAYMKSEKGQEEIARSLLKSVKDYSAYVLGTRLPEEATAEQTAAPASQAAAESAKEAESKSTAKQTNTKSSGNKSETKAPKKTASEKQESTPVQTSEPTPEKVAPTLVKSVEEPLRYTVQLMASQTNLPLRSPHFKSYAGKVKCYSAAGAFRYKYGVGEYESREEAQKHLREVRKVFPQAFVVCCRGTQIVK